MYVYPCTWMGLRGVDQILLDQTLLLKIRWKESNQDHATTHRLCLRRQALNITWVCPHSHMFTFVPHPISRIASDIRLYVPCAVVEVQFMVVNTGSHVVVCVPSRGNLSVCSRGESKAGNSDAFTGRCIAQVG